MSVYKEKICLLCDNLFVPTSPKQKYCDNCKEEGRKIAGRIRDKKRSRRNNNYTEYEKFCNVCGIRFKTYYSKKNYCGSVECEKQRVILKNKRTHLLRDKEYLKKKGKDYYVNNKKHCCSVKATTYRKQHPEAKDYVFGAKVANYTIEYIQNYIEERGYKLVSVEYKNTNSKISLRCPMGHIWETTFHAFQDKIINGVKEQGNRCFYCYVSNNYVSKPEQKIRDYFSDNYPNLSIIYNDRTQIHPKELDLYFPEQKVAVEVCGLYWHSEDNGKPRCYHYDKMISCYDKGIRLITIFEDEIYYKFDIVISRILQALHLTSNKIFARKCVVKEIEKKEANLFLDKNHIQGRSSSTKAFGLFYNDELISVATIGKINRKRTSTGDTIELKKFCTLNNTMVVAGAQKLFKYVKEFVKKDGYTVIKSYCCMRYANIFNPIYEILGFTLEGYTKYSPHYFKNGVRYRNFSPRKTPEGEEQGYKRIWDCGHRTYTYKLN